ncbi:MAG TPA: hypothetical protein VE172_21265 [Stackebrandtia sp.]|uniref:hypothetical protein n=1 Tax=Stackebrandtia sp. TaxID=2023065 RepID=UPI002D4D1343|nr:hypothetical protein [Stackebrandtia sp.]HZE41337.1 hypothetical protein [Stackebrandtia sp.]
MSSSAWIRGIASVVAWGGVTTVAALGSWLGLSSALTAGPADDRADSVIASSDTVPSRTPSSAQSSSSPKPTGRSGPRGNGGDSGDAIDGWSPVGGGVYERAFDTDGGTAVIQLSSAKAGLVSASPADGYAARTEHPSDDHLVVMFYSASGGVVIDASWRNGKPYATVSGS